MENITIILLGLVGAIGSIPVAIIISAGLGWLSGRKREICGSCKNKSLKHLTLIKATIRINGERAPDRYSYYICEKCGARYKLHRGEWLIPTDKEWELYVGENTPLDGQGRESSG